jgi:hypothetical protein
MFGNLFGGDSSFGEESGRLQRWKELYGNVPDPELRDLAPELITPETMNYELIKEDPALRSRQLDALSRLSMLADEGQSAEDMAVFERAKQQANQIAKQGTQSAIESARARGVGGSGLEFAMREMANQGGSASARARALNQQAYLQGLGSQRDQDLRFNSQNNDVINRFNQMNTTNRNQAAQYNAEQRMNSGRYNNDMSQRRYDNQMGRMDRQAGLERQANEVNAAERESRRRRGSALTGLVGAGIGAAFGGTTGAAIGRGIGSSF